MKCISHSPRGLYLHRQSKSPRQVCYYCLIIILFDNQQCVGCTLLCVLFAPSIFVYATGCRICGCVFIIVLKLLPLRHVFSFGTGVSVWSVYACFRMSRYSLLATLLSHCVWNHSFIYDYVHLFCNSFNMSCVWISGGENPPLDTSKCTSSNLSLFYIILIKLFFCLYVLIVWCFGVVLRVFRHGIFLWFEFPLNHFKTAANIAYNSLLCKLFDLDIVWSFISILTHACLKQVGASCCPTTLRKAH